MLFFNQNNSFEHTQFWKRASSVWNLILCFTSKYCKNNFCGQDRDPLFKDRYDMQDRRWFLSTRLFSLRIFQDTKLKNVVFQIKRHVWANTVLKRVHSHWSTQIGTGFYWFISFNFSNIWKSCFWSKIIFLSRHSFEK